VFDEDRFEEVKDELTLMMLAFCFRPDPEDDESAGVGVKISYDLSTLRFCFQEVGKGAGAFEAGFLPGDLILSIDGNKEVYLEDIYSITGMLRGAEGTEVDVEAYRDGITIQNKITRRKLIPEQIVFLNSSSGEVLKEKIKVFSSFILNSEDYLSMAGDEADDDLLGNSRWDYKLKFPGGFTGFLTHNTFLLDRFEISYLLASEENGDDTGSVYDYYKSIMEEALGDYFNIEEIEDEDEMVILQVTDPSEGVLTNFIELTFDKSSTGKSVMIEYIFPQ